MNDNKTNINWYPGHMAKTKREIKEKLDLIDVVIEVIDARIPFSSKNNDINDVIKSKPRILVMTKIDLCDMELTKLWKTYYERNGYNVILIDLINGKNVNSIVSEVIKVGSYVNEKRRLKGLKDRKIRALVLGIPNVGKSTLINRLVSKKVTNTGNRPGVTKSLEWIRVNKDIELLDSPGILWPKLDNNIVALNLASMTAIKEEILNRESVAIYIINTLLKYYKDSFINRYKISIDNFDDIVLILDSIGKYIGAIRNGEVDYERVYVTVLKDLRDGYFGGVTFDRYEDR